MTTLTAVPEPEAEDAPEMHDEGLATKKARFGTPGESFRKTVQTMHMLGFSVEEIKALLGVGRTAITSYVKEPRFLSKAYRDMNPQLCDLTNPSEGWAPLIRKSDKEALIAAIKAKAETHSPALVEEAITRIRWWDVCDDDKYEAEWNARKVRYTGRERPEGVSPNFVGKLIQALDDEGVEAKLSEKVTDVVDRLFRHHFEQALASQEEDKRSATV
jgi:hypothetical protein